MTHLHITERRKNTVLILDIEGKIILGEGCSNFRKALRFLVKNGEKKILLNLANVTYIDSSGLGELVSGYITLQENQGEVRLVNLTTRVHELMTLTKLLTIFEIFENESEAISSFNVPTFKAAYVGNML